METSSARTFKGSIPEAILQSKLQKKLFVVYIFGEDSVWPELEKSIWNDSKVAESISKYCILLHIPEGSTDAAHFSAIYGFVSAEVLASSLEKAWLSLHMQETNAAVLTAALASKKMEQSNTESSDVGASRHESSSGAVVPPALQVRLGTIEDDDSLGKGVEDESSKDDDRTTSESLIDMSSTVGSEQSTSPNSSADGVSSSIEDGHQAKKKIHSQNSGFFSGNSLVTHGKNEAVQDERGEGIDQSKFDTVDKNECVKASSDIHLNIRLPTGVSLQEKFLVTSTLRMVKAYVDSNQASGFGPYNLAIPYPRKVFTNEDLGKSLSDLGLFNRQALMVVPHQRATSYHGGSSSDQTTNKDSSVANSGGYFASIRRMLSYFNPLSYLGGSTSSSNSGQDQTGIWEYRPNSAYWNNSGSSERPHSSGSTNRSSSTPVRNDNRSRRPTTSGFGSNIHTLKRDEDDDRFNDRNSFWNGNSTQYGGSNDGK